LNEFTRNNKIKNVYTLVAKSLSILKIVLPRPQARRQFFSRYVKEWFLGLDIQITMIIWLQCEFKQSWKLKKKYKSKKERNVSNVENLNWSIYRVTDEKPLTLYLTYSLSDLNKWHLKWNSSKNTSLLFYSIFFSTSIFFQITLYIFFYSFL
jgi:hypothetical protein